MNYIVNVMFVKMQDVQPGFGGDSQVSSDV